MKIQILIRWYYLSNYYIFNERENNKLLKYVDNPNNVYLLIDVRYLCTAHDVLIINRMCILFKEEFFELFVLSTTRQFVRSSLFDNYIKLYEQYKFI